MCKRIRHTYYCEEMFLVKHKSKNSCESAIFYNLTADIVYSVCKFKYFFNTTVTPSVLDGSSHIFLANMLSPKRLICTQDYHLARPLPSYPYILVNRSMLCNCHMQTGHTYLLKSLGSCQNGAHFKMYFTINSAFSHYMSLFGLSQSTDVVDQLLPEQHVFDTFVNDSTSMALTYNNTAHIVPLDGPDTLLELFQSISSRAPHSPNSLFFPIVQHTSDKNPDFTTKGSFCTQPQPT